jgi:hypothetical protein
VSLFLLLDSKRKKKFETFFLTLFIQCLSLSLSPFTGGDEDDSCRRVALIHIAHYITSIPIASDVTACMNVVQYLHLRNGRKNEISHWHSEWAHGDFFSKARPKNIKTPIPVGLAQCNGCQKPPLWLLVLAYYSFKFKLFYYFTKNWISLFLFSFCAITI